MKTLINLALRLTGAGAVWGKVDGAKTYIAAGAAILSGALGLYTEFAAALTTHDAGALWALVKGLPADPAWLTLLGGFGSLGLRHAIGKPASAAQDGPSAAEEVKAGAAEAVKQNGG